MEQIQRHNLTSIKGRQDLSTEIGSILASAMPDASGRTGFLYIQSLIQEKELFVVCGGNLGEVAEGIGQACLHYVDVNDAVQEAVTGLGRVVEINPAATAKGVELTEIIYQLGEAMPLSIPRSSQMASWIKEFQETDNASVLLDRLRSINGNR